MDFVRTNLNLSLENIPPTDIIGVNFQTDHWSACAGKSYFGARHPLQQTSLALNLNSVNMYYVRGKIDFFIKI